MVARVGREQHVCIVSQCSVSVQLWKLASGWQTADTVSLPVNSDGSCLWGPRGFGKLGCDDEGREA